MRGGVQALARRERGCLPERYRAPQDGFTPLHLAACKDRSIWAWTDGPKHMDVDNEHASVVEKLLSAGAVTDAKTEVSQAGD